MSSSLSPPPGSSSTSLSATWPHLYHYVSQLVQTTPQTSTPTTSLHVPQHPLSVSSRDSDGSDEEDVIVDGEDKNETAKLGEVVDLTDDSARSHASVKLQGPLGKLMSSPSSSSSSPEVSRSHVSLGKEDLVRSVVEMLDGEREEDIKALLKDQVPGLDKDASALDQICLDLMHKHKDDVDHLPYQPIIAPTRVRSSPSLAHATPLRPFTPTRVPSFRAHTPLGRPHSPASVVRGSGAPTPSGSQPGTPTGGGVFTFPTGNFSSPKSSHSPVPGGSPLSSPRLLNAKAATYNPMGSPSTSRSNTGLPPPSSLAGNSDPWFSTAGSRSASPAPSAPSLTRTSSNLAIAAPLTSRGDDIAFAFHGGKSPGSIDTGSNNPATSHGSESEEPGVDDIFSSTANPYSRSGLLPDDDEDDEISPFGSPIRTRVNNISPTAVKLNLTAKAFDPTRLGPGGPGVIGNGNSSHDPTSGGMISPSAMALGMAMHSSNTGQPTGAYFERESSVSSNGEPGSGALTPGGHIHGSTSPSMSSTAAHMEELSAGMTPLDVLQSVFTSLPAGELEDALARSGYDFEGAMAILIAQNGGARSGASTPQRLGSPGPRPGFPRSASGTFRDGPGSNYFVQGGRAGIGGMGTGAISPRFGMSGTRSPGGPLSGGVMVVNGQRVCRYFLAGECRRADCRFSHDVDRALCRFWLRGQCAKGDQCEFVHTLPQVDPHMLSTAMSRIELSQDGTSRHGSESPLVDDFPDLHGARGQRTAFDPTRNRFANAVKKPSMQLPRERFVPPRRPPFTLPGLMANPARTAAAALPQPRPSPRIKLRPPTLLPTLPTGEIVNDAYMEARAAALRLGHARNACLARAADAWRRGDGAAAKRFSREANVLNEKMSSESSAAAAKLIKDRRETAQQAIQNRSNWSDDPSDRASRGKECAGGLGVIMGVASAKGVGLGGTMLSAEERTECLIDLHALHAAEGVELLEEFLVNLERENFYGLAYVVVGDERHVGNQDPARGASRLRLATGVKQFLARWGYPWSEGGGVLCVDAATHF